MYLLQGISGMTNLTSLRLPSSPALSLASCREMAHLSLLHLLDLSHANCSRAPEGLTDAHLACLLPGLPCLQVGLRIPPQDFFPLYMNPWLLKMSSSQCGTHLPAVYSGLSVEPLSRTPHLSSV